MLHRAAVHVGLCRLGPRPGALAPAGAAAKMSSSAVAKSVEVAVVGGGISGLHCARTLAQYGYTVSLFDMGKSGPGGRMSARRTAWQSLTFDHGCQFFHAQSADMRNVVRDWVEAGVACEWDGVVGRLNAADGTFTSRAAGNSSSSGGPTASQIGISTDGHFGVLVPGPLYVGTPHMDAITHHLATHSGLAECRHDVQVKRAAYDASSGKWLLEGLIRQAIRSGEIAKAQPPYTPWNLGIFDALVLADKMTGCKGTPGYVELQGTKAGLHMQEAMSSVKSSPQLALLLTYPAPAPGAAPLLPFDGAAVLNSPHIQWISMDSAKPGRRRPDGLQTLVALSTPSFAEQLCPRNADGSLPPQTPELLAGLMDPLQDALQQVLEPALRHMPGGPQQLLEPVFKQVHRWGSAFPAHPVGVTCFKAERVRLAACGDFCLGAGVENAVLSGTAAADAVRQFFEA